MGLVLRGLAIDAARVGFTVVDLARLFGKALADVIAIGLDLGPQLAEFLPDLDRHGRHLGGGCRGLLAALADARRHGSLGGFGIAAFGAGELAAGHLPVGGAAVTKPGLEDMALGAFDVEQDHCRAILLPRTAGYM